MYYNEISYVEWKSQNVSFYFIAQFLNPQTQFSSHTDWWVKKLISDPASNPSSASFNWVFLTSSSVSVHYDSQFASNIGMWFISHKMSDGSERPVAYASHKLRKPEIKCAWIEKEVLGIIIRVIKIALILAAYEYDVHG